MPTLPSGTSSSIEHDLRGFDPVFSAHEHELVWKKIEVFNAHGILQHFAECSSFAAALHIKGYSIHPVLFVQQRSDFAVDTYGADKH